MERLTAVALKRNGHTHFGHRSHLELRRSLGIDERPTDETGFWTSTGRFVTRDEAVPIGVAAGQIPRHFSGRPLLSSDINWDAHSAGPVQKLTRQQVRAQLRKERKRA